MRDTLNILLPLLASATSMSVVGFCCGDDDGDSGRGENVPESPQGGEESDDELTKMAYAKHKRQAEESLLFLTQRDRSLVRESAAGAGRERLRGWG